MGPNYWMAPHAHPGIPICTNHPPRTERKRRKKLNTTFYSSWCFKPEATTPGFQRKVERVRRKFSRGGCGRLEFKEDRKANSCKVGSIFPTLYLCAPPPPARGTALVTIISPSQQSIFSFYSGMTRGDIFKGHVQCA